MSTVKQQFIAELEPLLLAAERAIRGNNAQESAQTSMKVFALATKYAGRLDPAEFRDALNSPVANAIAERLGVMRDGKSPTLQ
jgi:hypothetical protein